MAFTLRRLRASVALMTPQPLRKFGDKLLKVCGCGCGSVCALMTPQPLRKFRDKLLKVCGCGRGCGCGSVCECKFLCECV